MRMDQNTRERVGILGEQFVAKLMKGRLSSDKYDSEKDMTLSDGTLVEVKTEVRYRKENAFTVDYSKKTNLNKCVTVDRLLFVEYGTYGNIRIYECTDRTYRLVKAGYRTVAAWDIGKMKLIYDKPDKLAHELVKLSVTPIKFLDDSYLY